MKIFIGILFSCLISFNLLAQTERQIKRIKLLEINSSINPATYNYLKQVYQKSALNDLVLIKMNTPGGLVSTTKEIITMIGESKAVTAIWITPEGASATSAGAIIAASAHLLFMSPGTNIGAATPIGMGGDIEQKDARSKAINDLVAMVQSLAETRGRNGKAFSEMISDAKSFTAQVALEQKVCDGIASSLNDLQEKINNKVVNHHGEKIKLTLNDQVSIQSVEMDMGQALLDILANPSFTYILFLLGAALIYFEFQAPGGFIAGSIGALCLILAGIGFQVLPLNFGSLGLIILAFILFILEFYITSYGVLTLAGITSLVFGSLFLYRTENAYIDFELSLVVSAVSGVLLFVGLVAYLVIKDRRRKKEDFFVPVGKTGEVVKKLENGIYQIKVYGEIWKAVSEQQLELHDKVEVVASEAKDLVLNIKKI
jgi:membrane-bound serine protease (ClpP class)